MLIDIYNDRNERTGTAGKNEAHANGWWHRTFSAQAFIPERRTVLLQKKAPGRAGFDRPRNYADFTVGGHYHAGEDIPDGVREAREELGLTWLKYGNFVPVGIRQTAVTLAPERIEREFQYWNLLPLPGLTLADIPLDDAEVAGLVEVGLDNVISLVSGRAAQTPARYLTRAGDRRDVTSGTLAAADLIPGYLATDQLYLRIFVCIRRYLAGDREHLFW